MGPTTPCTPHTPRRALASKDTNTPLDSPAKAPPPKLDAAPVQPLVRGTSDESAPAAPRQGSECGRCPGNTVAAQAGQLSDLFGSTPQTGGHHVPAKSIAPHSLGGGTPALPLFLAGDEGEHDYSPATGTHRSHVRSTSGASAPGVWEYESSGSERSSARSTAPSSPPSPPLPLAQTPATSPSETATSSSPAQATPRSGTSPGHMPLSAFARANPQLRVFKLTPPSSLVRSSCSAAEYATTIHSAATKALAALDISKVHHLAASGAAAQAKWLEEALAAAGEHRLAVAPVRLPAEAGAYEYMIPGCGVVWVVPLKARAGAEGVVAPEKGFTRPRAAGSPLLSGNPFETSSGTRQARNPFAPRLQGKAKTPTSLSLGDSPFSDSGGCGLAEGATDTPTKAPNAVPERHPLAKQRLHSNARLPSQPAYRHSATPGLLYPKPPPRAFSHNHAARARDVYNQVAAKRVPRRYNQPTTPQAWSEYVHQLEVDNMDRKVREGSEIEALLNANSHEHQQRMHQHAAERGSHQWAHVAPLAHSSSACTLYAKLVAAYPHWVAGASEAWADMNHRPGAPCQDCAGLAKDREMLAWLELQAKPGLKPSLAARAERDIALLADYLADRAAEAHECPEVRLDRLPEDSTTLLEYRIFYGLGKTPTIPCLFWSCAAAYDAAVTKLVRLHTRAHPVRGAVDPALLQKVKTLTSTLRKELYALGAFVGWLPLDYGSPAPPTAPALPLRKQHLARTPLTERRPSGPDWLAYQLTYRPLGPDAAFWYDRLDRGIVMFDACFDPSLVRATPRPDAPPDAHPHPPATEGAVEHLGARYALVPCGAAWRTFPDAGAELPPWPRFDGTSIPVVAVMRRRPGLAQSLSGAVFELAVRAQAW